MQNIGKMNMKPHLHLLTGTMQSAAILALAAFLLCGTG
jgi:hypothetical protein